MFIKITDLIINKQNGTYHLRIETSDMKRVNYAHNVYSGVGMNNKPNVSRAYKLVSEAVKNNSNIELVKIDQETAQKLFNELRTNDMVFNIEPTRSNGDRVIRLK